METTSQQLFDDDEMRAGFQSRGYCCMPLLDEAGIRELKSLYQSISAGSNDGFFTSMNLEKVDDRRRVDARIKSLIAEKAAALLPGYRPLLGNFTVKAPQGESELRIHLDWSVVDERKHRTIGIWIPLSDVDARNGALGILEGSHRFGHSMRGSMVNFMAADGSLAKGPFLEKIKETYPAKLLCLKAGTAVFYDLSLAHFSPPNQSRTVRLATNLMMIPEGAQPLHYYRDETGVIKQLKVDEEFFLTRNMVAAPDMETWAASPEVLPETYRVEEQYGTSVTILPGEYEEERSFAAEEQPASAWSWKGIMNLFSGR